MNIKVSASILAADFLNLQSEIEKISGADYIHIDVMDGSFVPNITMGAGVVKEVKKITNVPLDVHLMVSNPELLVDSFIDAGADMITFHAESTIHIDRLIDRIKDCGIKAGIALVPSTHESLLEYIIEKLDLVLIMTVNPGFCGQKFLESQLKKISNVKNIISSNKLETLIFVDGGIDLCNIKSVAKAGADVVISGSSLFQSKNYNEFILNLKCEY